MTVSTFFIINAMFIYKYMYHINDPTVNIPQKKMIALFQSLRQHRRKYMDYRECISEKSSFRRSVFRRNYFQNRMNSVEDVFRKECAGCAQCCRGGVYIVFRCRVVVAMCVLNLSPK